MSIDTRRLGAHGLHLGSGQPPACQLLLDGFRAAQRKCLCAALEPVGVAIDGDRFQGCAAFDAIHDVLLDLAAGAIAQYRFVRAKQGIATEGDRGVATPSRSVGRRGGGRSGGLCQRQAAAQADEHGERLD